jgi:hypothetical protein
VSEDKNAAFHRLASQRVEKFEEAFKIFSNLCGPSYQRTPDEVMAYFARIDAARDKALARFQECKWWRDAQPAEIEPLAPMEPEPVQPDPEPEETAPAPPQRPSRASTIAELLRNAETNEVEALAEMVAMQREVIERLQERLDGKVE